MLMKAFIGTIAGMAMVASIASTSQDTPFAQALQGTWRLTSLNGRPIPERPANRTGGGGGLGIFAPPSASEAQSIGVAQ